MTAKNTTRRSLNSPPLRAFDPDKDLAPVADLVALCFADTLDPDGDRYLKRMRSAAKRPGSRHLSKLGVSPSLPSSGFVWVEHGVLVGNLSTISIPTSLENKFLIANVAVHPDFRGRGIARLMTLAALRKLYTKGVQSVWLQVRDDNPAALHIYTSMGFEYRAKRSTWHRNANHNKAGIKELDAEQMPINVRKGFVNRKDWNNQLIWLNQNYPKNLRWNWQHHHNIFRPGIWGGLYRLATETTIRQWSIDNGAELLGVISWQPTFSFADRLWLAAAPSSEDETIRFIIPAILEDPRLHRPLSIEYPAGQAVDALGAVGFKQHNTLIWMELTRLDFAFN